MKSDYLVLFSGGTGGHVIPAVNYGNYLIDCDYNCTLFLDKRGLQYASQFKGRVLCISSAHFSGNTLYKLKSIFHLLYGLMQSFYYSHYHHQRAVLSSFLNVFAEKSTAHCA